jgi:hypothetical protein
MMDLAGAVDPAEEAALPLKGVPEEVVVEERVPASRETHVQLG